MTAKRAAYVMVDEADPQWVRFWNAYPRRVSKKEARRMWAALKPTPETVDAMVAALAWQVTVNKWDGEKADYAPYPASWLNAERWTDEPPAQRIKAPRWECPHVDYCGHRAMCEIKLANPAKYPVRAA